MAEDDVVFDDIVVGKELREFVFEMTPDVIAKYLEALEEDDPLYTDDETAGAWGFPSCITPPGIVAVFFVRAFHTEMKPPPGGIQAKQEFAFYQPALPGDILTTRTRVVAKYEKKERKYVEFETLTVNQRDEKIVRSKATAIWPR